MSERIVMMRSHLLSIFTAGVKAVYPRELIKKNLQLTNDTLKIANQMEINLENNLHVIGFGKATLAMASAVDEILNKHICGGIVSIPIGTQENFKQRNQIECLLKPSSKIQIFEGAANNIPDDNSLTAARHITNYIQNLTSNDIILVLISGGGSALLPSPIPPITIEDKQKTIKLLTSRGANIKELNIVRKKLSLLKGGGLARLSKSKIISLILSDIIGDPLDLIASGPTVGLEELEEDALVILERFELTNSVPDSVLKVLNSKSDILMTPLSNVTNILIGNNALCLSVAKNIAEGFGYATIILSSELDGEARKCGEFLAGLSHSICNYFETGELNWLEVSGHHLFKKIGAGKMKGLEEFLINAKENNSSVCVLAGGETTVVLRNANGVGGRNQELILSCSIALDEIFSSQLKAKLNVAILSAGTDGIDGPTNAAGAITDLMQKTDAEEQGLSLEQYLEENNSNLFYERYNDSSDLIVTGHTGTNVMDVQVILVDKK